ncbi:hypothetical protein RclHR1_01580009 [Rhizophagus clarus]|uniref:Kinase-like domain-containing protein n=1 Tax=Rhizophagus clarus TaxID=94130 RepID=A0A2Z6R8R7_9GLOM|nr:hypothetical protein RclHR1_01580009 [Rhizophagus clarus]GES78646.1 kinase-like domain-containing protein [Rhizophagus clarus]
MTLIKEWIEEKIKNGKIRYFDNDKFSQIVKIGDGDFGQVNKANLADIGLVVLKFFLNKNSDKAYDKFANELNLLHEIDYQNINRVLGITENLESYILVSEYANGGNLRDYLKKEFTSLKWSDKIQMALDITNGLKFLHSKKNNPWKFVNNGKLLIADLGLTKMIGEIRSCYLMDDDYKMKEYIDPQRFKNIGCKKDKKSDIYSLGVLLWEISSGYPPFLNLSIHEIAFHILYMNLREEPIEGTPAKYQNLYQECWDFEPKSRPDIEEVYEILNRLKNDL